MKGWTRKRDYTRNVCTWLVDLRAQALFGDASVEKRPPAAPLTGAAGVSRHRTIFKSPYTCRRDVGTRDDCGRGRRWQSDTFSAPQFRIIWITDGNIRQPQSFVTASFSRSCTATPPECWVPVNKLYKTFCQHHTFGLPCTVCKYREQKMTSVHLHWIVDSMTGLQGDEITETYRRWSQQSLQA